RSVTAAGEDPNRRSLPGQASSAATARASSFSIACATMPWSARNRLAVRTERDLRRAATSRMTDQSNPMNPTKAAATTTSSARHGPGVAEAPAKPRILSGMRPTGRLHLGNLVGALQNWVGLQDEYESYHFVADWHMLTTDYANTSELQNNIREMVTDWLAAGLDPKKATFFIQSRLPEHAELHVIFTMITPIG